MLTTSLKDPRKEIGLWLFALAVPIIIYIYFFDWQNISAFGDDLYIYRNYTDLHSFSEKVNMTVSSGKYRPVTGFFMQLVIEWFQKNLHGYYLFNVAVQTINTFIFALLLNLFLRSPYFSLFFSLLLGLSRFTYFNIVQLLNGGPLEGIAMTFFLASLYFILRAATRNDWSVSQKQRGFIWSIVFANLSMYTHERYIVLFPFLAVAIFVLPSFRSISYKTKIILAGIAVFSILFNVYLKKNVFDLPFAVGTGGTMIEVSFATAISFFRDAILSIFQINSGPAYLAGIDFSDMPGKAKLPAILLASGLVLILGLYLARVRRFFALKQKDKQSEFLIFFLLAGLGILLLIPAVVTIRLEPRWLQAPFSIFVLLIAIAFNNLKFKSVRLQNMLMTALILLFLVVDGNYFFKGVSHLYSTDSFRLSAKVKKAINSGLIRPETENIYIWEIKRDANSEAAINWIMADGYIFDFYQGRSKKIFFADSMYQKNYQFPMNTFGNFNKRKDQIIYFGDDIIDLSNDYIRDSLKNFNQEKAAKLMDASRLGYNKDNLIITNSDFDKFTTTGFYDRENNIRWTNGNAAIEFKGEYTRKDSLTAELNTYLPLVCKDIVPKVSLVDNNNNEYQPMSFSKKGDQFNYRFFLDHAVTIQKIRLMGDTINAAPDQRALSFPFISLELKQ